MYLRRRHLSSCSIFSTCFDRCKWWLLQLIGNDRWSWFGNREAIVASSSRKPNHSDTIITPELACHAGLIWWPSDGAVHFERLLCLLSLLCFHLMGGSLANEGFSKLISCFFKPTGWWQTFVSRRRSCWCQVLLIIKDVQIFLLVYVLRELEKGMEANQNVGILVAEELSMLCKVTRIPDTFEILHG